ncbi:MULTISPECIES: arsenate reductase family protein [Streptococcus]|uniref:Arsenate reductase n=1 Tax=Streptococcus intermedius B196 TaxID=862967 RepID=T1ZFT5_STRIT|nr:MULTISPECIES: arsenate reductase family protein [Streptococcus]AGU76571.1 arsenate reductase [Streptococcus intermedius B196]AGU78410.1 arsenate reductase [Streptococcus intermedius C270]MDK8091185.1 arsenate reductase family protein [Streptococcus intermedius]MDN5016885.1 arsenate reductase family protein [Streptococcus sp. SI1]MDP1432923.1 arsenate reductase family protein [Streptococcus intermedius]
MLRFIEYPKCSTCRKAKAELERLGLEFEAVDIVNETPSKEEILTWIENSDLCLKSFFNTSGLKYRELGLKDKLSGLSIEEAADLLAADGMLIKRPILEKDGKILQIGYRKEYATLDL